MSDFLPFLLNEIKTVLLDHGDNIFLPDEVLTETERRHKAWLRTCYRQVQRHMPKTTYFKGKDEQGPIF